MQDLVHASGASQHCHGDHLQTMKMSPKVTQDSGKQHQRDHRRQAKTQATGDGATDARACQSYGHANLTVGWPRPKLAKADDIAIGLVIEPAPGNHQFLAKIAQRHHRPAKPIW